MTMRLVSLCSNNHSEVTRCENKNVLFTTVSSIYAGAGFIQVISVQNKKRWKEKLLERHTGTKVQIYAPYVVLARGHKD